MRKFWQKLFTSSRIGPSANNDMVFHGKSMKLGNDLAQDLPKPMRGKVKILQRDPVTGGGHCLIFLGELQDGKKVELVALKLLNVHVPKHEKQMFRREVQAWCRFHHQNVLEYYGTCTLNSQLFMVSPWMQNGNLLQYLKENPTANRQNLIFQAAGALVYLHDDVGMVHGDIKAENVLISDKETVLLADFGLSTRIEKLVGEIPTPAHIRTLGSSRFTAPELIAYADAEPEVASEAPSIAQYPSKTVKTDVYAFGMLILQTFTGSRPWLHVGGTLQVFRLVLEGAKPPRPRGDAILRGLDDLHWSIAERCWELQPDNRPHMRDIVRDLTPRTGDVSLLTTIDNQVDANPLHAPSFDLTTQILIDAEPRSYGGSADIFHALWMPYHTDAAKEVAIKVFRTSPVGHHTANLHKRVERELTIWSKFHHPHVLPIYGTCIFRSFICAVSPWMPNGDCLHYLKLFPGANRLQLLLDVAQAIAYLHSLSPPVVHGDIKATNVLISDDGHALLADFGTAKLLDSGQHELTGDSQIVGSLRWMAPELFEDTANRVTTAADIYSFGMLLLEIFTERPPFAHLTNTGIVIHHILQGQKPERPPHLDDFLWGLLERCWETNPSDRPLMSDIALALYAKDELEGGH